MGKFSDTFMLEDPDGVNVEYSVKACKPSISMHSSRVFPHQMCLESEVVAQKVTAAGMIPGAAQQLQLFHWQEVLCEK